jgi:D-lactate dehydrogenase
MKIAVFGAKSYDRASFEAANAPHGHELVFFKPNLGPQTCPLAEGFSAVCAFVNDQVGRDVLDALARGGTRLLAMRSAGYNNVDIEAARELGITVARVPAYSPYAIAEHTVGLILALNRKLHRAYNRVREGNFALDGLLGFDLHGRAVGIVGTGQIGMRVARIMHGFGCRLLAHDRFENEECKAIGVEYLPLDGLLAESDIVTLHCPLTPETRHLIDAEALHRVKPGMMLINTSRGAVIDTRAVIAALKRGQIGHLGLDVYEEETGVFFEDGSGRTLQDDVLARLLTFPNVLITGHQGFFTREALGNIAETTLANVSAFGRGERSGNEVTPEMPRG